MILLLVFFPLKFLTTNRSAWGTIFRCIYRTLTKLDQGVESSKPDVFPFQPTVKQILETPLV